MIYIYTSHITPVSPSHAIPTNFSPIPLPPITLPREGGQRRQYQRARRLFLDPASLGVARDSAGSHLGDSGANSDAGAPEGDGQRRRQPPPDAALARHLQRRQRLRVPRAGGRPLEFILVFSRDEATL